MKRTEEQIVYEYIKRSGRVNVESMNKPGNASYKTSIDSLMVKGIICIERDMAQLDVWDFYRLSTPSEIVHYRLSK
jgi:hypothetical protein